LLLVPHLFVIAMEDYEMKHGTATSAYDVPEVERAINPSEDNDLVQLGYKPELEVLRCHVLLPCGQMLTQTREDSAYGL
jgi:hypothetical protein